MKALLVCIAILAVGCKNKDEKAAEVKPTETTRAAEPAAPPAAELSIPGGIAECEALVATYKKVPGCAKISADDKAVDQVSMMQLKDIAKPYLDAKAPEDKDIMKKAAVTQCSDLDGKLKQQLAAGGC